MQTLKIYQIEPNRNQPRKKFDEDALNELAKSIQEYGILEPLIVRDCNTYYEIIAGERRWRAARIAGLKEVPVIIRELSDQQRDEIALIENIQREDLNPIEEARAYQKLIQDYHYVQRELSEKISKNRSVIANTLRLLNLEVRVQEYIISGQLTTGHAKPLLAIEDPDLQYSVATKIVESKMTVREVEKMVRKMLRSSKKEKISFSKTDQLDSVFHDIEDRMRQATGTKVMIERKDNSNGIIKIEYYSNDDLEKILDLLER